MFDFGIGTSELLILAIVALIVVGPKELPGLLRAIGRMVGKVKALAAEFQGHLDDLARESGVDDVKKKVQQEFEELSIEDLDREFSEIEREMREQLAAGARPLDKAREADDEDLIDETERPLPETLDLDSDPGDSGEDGEREEPESGTAGKPKEARRSGDSGQGRKDSKDSKNSTVQEAEGRNAQSSAEERAEDVKAEDAKNAGQREEESASATRPERHAAAAAGK